MRILMQGDSQQCDNLAEEVRGTKTIQSHTALLGQNVFGEEFKVTFKFCRKSVCNCLFSLC